MEKLIRCDRGHLARVDLVFTDPRPKSMVKMECPRIGCDGTVEFGMEGHGGYDIRSADGKTKEKYVPLSQRR